EKPVDPTPKPVETVPVNSNRVVINLYFSNFDLVGGVRLVWGSVKEFGINNSIGKVEWIDAQPPLTGQVNVICKEIVDVGTVDIIAQLSDASSTALREVTRYKLDEGKRANISVQPNLETVTATEKGRIKAGMAVEAHIKAQPDLSVPLKVILV